VNPTRLGRKLTPVLTVGVCDDDVVEVRVWTRSDRLHQTDYALSVSPVIQRFYATQLAAPYSLPKLGHSFCSAYRNFYYMNTPWTARSITLHVF